MNNVLEISIHPDYEYQEPEKEIEYDSQFCADDIPF